MNLPDIVVVDFLLEAFCRSYFTAGLPALPRCSIQDEPTVRVIAQSKNSLAPEGKSIAFELAPERGFQWKGACEITVDEFLSGGGQVQTKTMQMEDELKTISNGYRADGRKISKEKTITVPDTVPRKQIEQYVNHVAVELERVFKTGYAEYGEMSFEEYSRHWLSRQLKYSQGTKESYRRILEKVYPYIGDIAIAKLRPLALENMLAELRKMQHHGKPIKESTVQKYLTVVSAVLSDAKRNEIIQKNPARMIDLPQCEQSKQFVPTDEEAQLLLTEFCNLPLTYETYYVLAMFTGCRRGELCALKWSDVTIYDNYDWATINISRSRSSVPGNGIVEGSTKSGRSRTVAVDSDIAGLIACLYTEKEREANERGEELSEYIFTNEHGKLIYPDTFSKTLRKIYDSIGLPHEFHLHTLRHYYVTTLLHSGVDKQTVADLVGHCDTSFLERTYCHPRLDKKRSAAEVFAAVQFGESIRSRP